MPTSGTDPGQLSPADEQRQLEACRKQCVDGVRSAFADLPENGSKLEIHTLGKFPSRYRYTLDLERNNGGNENHFQGCQRLLAGPYIAISGGDWKTPSSHLFIGKLESVGQRLPWGSNLGSNGPPATDGIVARIDLDRKMWHAGGMATCGHVLAVPVECGKVAFSKPRAVRAPRCTPDQSQIMFFYMGRPASPRLLNTTIVRKDRKATAIALTRIAGQGYVAAVLSAGVKDDKHRDKQIEIYRTIGTRLASGFGPPRRYRVPKKGEPKKFDNYQTINFVHDKSGDLYLLGLTGKIADLFQVTLPDVGIKTRLEFVAREKFSMSHRYGGFSAGAAVYAKDGKLAVYSVPLFRFRDGRLGFTEWVA